MLSVLIVFIPLALASITPTTVMLVTGLLAAGNGVARALAIVAGRFTAFLLISAALVYIFTTIPNRPDFGSVHPELVSIVLVICGAILLTLAARTWTGQTDPDKPPGRITRLLKSTGPAALFAANFLLCFFSVRLITLAFAGASTIDNADLDPTPQLLMTIVLAFVLVWSTALPLAIYHQMGSRRDTLILEFQTLLETNKKLINATILAAAGGFLLVTGALLRY